MFLDIFYSSSQKVKVITKKCEFGEVAYIYINEKILYKLNKSLYRRLFSLYFKIKILKRKEYIYILSKNISKYNFDEFLNSFSNLKKAKLTKNEILKNSIKYLENEIQNSNICMVTNNISKEILLKYIDRFKHVSIYTNSSIFLNYLKDVVLKIEEETGTLVDVIYEGENMCGIECDLLIYLEDIHVSSKIKYKKMYVLTSNILDKFSEEYKLLQKYKDELYEIDNYSSRELASAILYLHNLNVKN